MEAENRGETPSAAPSQPVDPSTPKATVHPLLRPEDIEAVARSSVALADGAQAFGRAVLAMQRDSIAAGLSAARALVDARNLQDVLEVQRRYLTGSVEQAVRRSGGFAELASRVANEAWAPLLPRVTMALERRRRS